MISKSILFYWSKGAEIRRKIVKQIGESNKKKQPSFLNKLSSMLGISHVAAKKHIDLLIDEGYIEPMNPGGKPIYLKLTKACKGVYDKTAEKKKKR